MGLRTNDLSSLTVNEASVISSASAGLKDFRFACKNSPETLKTDSASIPYGGIIGIIGHNGAGKSTFSGCFYGLKKHRGTVTVDGTSCRARERLNKCYMVMQDAGHQLFTESVLGEVLISMAKEDEKAVLDILESMEKPPCGGFSDPGLYYITDLTFFSSGKSEKARKTRELNFRLIFRKNPCENQRVNDRNHDQNRNMKQMRLHCQIRVIREGAERVYG